MAQAPIFGAGGIVVRDGQEPLVAIVQRRKDNEWVLPKGKLKRHESAVAAAEREVMEETGQDVVVGEFLGAVSYRVGRRPKVVQFWRMQAWDHPARKLAKDIKAVKWLPLEAAIRKLTDPLEQVFLQNIAERNLAAPAKEHSPLAEPGQSTQPAAPSSTLPPATMQSAAGQIAVLPPDLVHSKQSAVVTSAPRAILGSRQTPPPAATKSASTVPVARLNWLDRILHRLWRDRTNLS